MIRLMVGLGNPGFEYDRTRHNAGFWFLDALAKKHNLKFSLEGKFFGEIAKLRFQDHDVLLLKPQMFMNISGKSVLAVANFYKILPDETLVCHDELDFAPGVAKLKQGGGNGGHNGLKDIERVLGKNFWRLRLGIGHPGESTKVVGYVLNKPTLDEMIAIDLSIDKAVSVCDKMLVGDLAIAQKILHTK